MVLTNYPKKMLINENFTLSIKDNFKFHFAALVEKNIFYKSLID